MRRHLILFTMTGLLLLTVTACGSKAVMNTETTAMEQSENMKMEETTAMGQTGSMKMEQTGQSKDGEAPESMGETNMAASAGKMNQGTPAPDFEMTDLKGNKVRLSDFKGQKVYIKYWASWCPICLGGLEDINTLSGENDGFQVLTIVAPGQKGEKNVEDFKKWFSGVDHTENIKVLFDTDGAYGKKAGVRGYPTSEYIGSDGVLVKIVPGHADNDTIINNFKTIK